MPAGETVYFLKFHCGYLTQLAIFSFIILRPSIFSNFYNFWDELFAICSFHFQDYVKAWVQLCKIMTETKKKSVNYAQVK